MEELLQRMLLFQRVEECEEEEKRLKGSTASQFIFEEGLGSDLLLWRGFGHQLKDRREWTAEDHKQIDVVPATVSMLFRSPFTIYPINFRLLACESSPLK